MRVQSKAAGKELKDDINLQDKYGKTPLYVAVESGNAFVIKELYSTSGGYSPDPMMAAASGWTVMHAAVHADKFEIIKLLDSLLGSGRMKLLLQTEDKTSRLPLHIAAYKAEEDTVAFLAKRCKDLGIDMSKKDSSGNDASKLAGKSNRRKSREIIESFTEDGAPDVSTPRVGEKGAAAKMAAAAAPPAAAPAPAAPAPAAAAAPAAAEAKKA